MIVLRLTVGGYRACFQGDIVACCECAPALRVRGRALDVADDDSARVQR